MHTRTISRTWRRPPRAKLEPPRPACKKDGVCRSADLKIGFQIYTISDMYDTGHMSSQSPAEDGSWQRSGEADAMGRAAQKKPRSVCPHQHQRSQCKECGGAGLCTSTITRGIKTRGGWGGHQPTQVPEEQMQGVRGGQTSARTSAGGANARSQGGRASARTSDRDAGAKECGGAQHLRSKCKECGKSIICPHQRERSQCKVCWGASICQHLLRNKCKEFGLSTSSPHQLQRRRARSTGGQASARTNTRGANARSAGGQASVRTSPSGANARIAKG